MMELVEARRIWDQAPHNAFTDLARFQNRWFCAFREGKTHLSPDGALRVITSPDGGKWESAALITSPDSDLRDAKITVTPDGRLMLCGAEVRLVGSKRTYQSLAWFSKDGRAWSEKRRDRRSGRLALARHVAQGEGVRHRVRLRQGFFAAALRQRRREEIRCARGPPVRRRRAQRDLARIRRRHRLVPAAARRRLEQRLARRFAAAVHEVGVGRPGCAHWRAAHAPPAGRPPRRRRAPL